MSAFLDIPRSGRRAAAVALVVLCVGTVSPAVRAHSPHDVINVVAVAPDFPADGTIFAACVFTRHRLFVRSTDGGRSWQVMGRPFANETPSCFVFSPAYAVDETVFCGTTEGGVWRSTDRGTTWSPVLPGHVVHDLAISPGFDLDGTIVAATTVGALRSTDGGDNWAPSNTGLVETSLSVARYGPDGSLWTGGKTVHRSGDDGASWTPATTFAHRITCLVPSPAEPTGATLAAAFGRAGVGVFLSFDAGMSFAAANDGLVDLEVDRLAFAPEGTLFALADKTGCFRLDTPSGTWTTSSTGLEPPSNQSTVHFRDVAVSPAYATDSTVVLGTFEGCFVSDDGGDTWEQLNLYDLRVNRVLQPSPTFGDDGLVFLGNYGSGVGLGRLVELAPELAPQPLPGGPGGGGTAPAPGGALVQASAGASFSPAPGRVASPQGGPRAPLDFLAPHPPAWQAEGAGMITVFIASIAVSPDFAHDRTVWAGHVGLYRSRDAGHTWDVLPQPEGLTVWRAVTPSPTFAVDRLLLAGSSEAGTWRSDDAGDSWTLVGGGLPTWMTVTGIEFSPDFASDGRVWVSTNDNGLWRSIDGGATWTQLGLADADIRWLDVASGTELFAGTVNDGLYRSVDGGDTLLPSNTGLPTGGPIVIESVSASPDFSVDGIAFLVSLYDGVYKTTDGGSTWAPASAGLSPDAPRVVAVSPAFAVDQTVLLTTHAGFWRSTDAGASWQRLPGLAHADNGHQSVEHVGSWSSEVSYLGASAGSMYEPKSFAWGTTSSDTPGDTIRFGFFGDSVEWQVLRDPGSGIAEVTVDGGPPVVVDLYAPSTLYRQRGFLKRFPAPGLHVVEVTVTGTQGPFAQGAEIHDEGFIFTY